VSIRGDLEKEISQDCSVVKKYHFSVLKRRARYRYLFTFISTSVESN